MYKISFRGKKRLRILLKEYICSKKIGQGQSYWNIIIEYSCCSGMYHEGNSEEVLKYFVF